MTHGYVREDHKPVLRDHVLDCVREGGGGQAAEVSDAVERLIRSR